MGIKEVKDGQFMVCLVAHGYTQIIGVDCLREQTISGIWLQTAHHTNYVAD